MSETINISKTNLEKAKIVASKIEDKTLRKRAYALNLIANVAAEYITQSGLAADTNLSLCHVPAFVQNLELADIYISGIRLDVRLSIDGKTFCIPKVQEKYDAKPYAYVVVQLEKDLSAAKILGFVPTNELSAVQSKTEYLPYDISVLKPMEELRVFLATVTPQQQIFSAAEHEKIKELCTSFIDGELSESENVYFMKHVIACPVCREVFCELSGFDTIVSQVKNYSELLNDSTLSVLSGNKREVDEAALANMAVVENSQEAQEETVSSDEEAPVSTEETPLEALSQEPDIVLDEHPEFLDEIQEDTVIAMPEEEQAEETSQEQEIQLEEEAGTLELSEDLPPILPMGAPLPEETLNEPANVSNDQEDDENDFLLDLSEDQEELQDNSQNEKSKDFDEEKEENDDAVELSDEVDLSLDESVNETETLEENKKDAAIDENDILLDGSEETLSLPDDEELAPLVSEEESLQLEEDLSAQEEIKEDAAENTIELSEDIPAPDSFDEPLHLEEVQDITPLEESSETTEDIVSDTAEEDAISLDEQPAEKDEENTPDIKEEETSETISYSQEPVELVYDDEEENQIQENKTPEEDITNIDEETNQEPEEKTDSLSETDQDIQALLDDDLLALLSDGNENEPQEEEQVLPQNSDAEQEQISDFDENNTAQQEDTIAEEPSPSADENETIESLYGDTAIPEQNGNDPAQFELAAEPVSEKTVNATKKIIIGAAILALLAGGGAVSWFFNHSKTTQDNTALETANQDGEFFDLTNEAGQKENEAPAISQDINKSMTNSFSDKPAAITITKLSWQVSEKLAAEASVKEYLQTAGKNIQMNLQNDLANSADINFNNMVKVSFTIAPDNTMKGMQVLESSGSDQIDEIVLRSIKNTLKYVSVPKLKDFKSDYFLTLIINF